MHHIRITQFITYCREQRGLSEHSLRAYQQDMETFRSFLIVEDSRASLCSDSILAFRAHLRDVKGSSPATIRRRIVTLRAYFNWLEHDQSGDQSPFTGLRLDIKVPQSLPRPVDRPVLAELMELTKNSAMPDCLAGLKRPGSRLDSRLVTGLVLRLLVVTGLRIGELTHIRLMDVSGGGSQIRVRGKGNRERSVYVTNQRLLADFRAFLHRRHEQDGPESYLFLNRRGGRLTEAAFRKRLRTLSDSLKISPALTPHRFRHSAATLLIEEGVDIRIVQRLLGHASISTTEIYTKVSDNSLYKAVAHADTLAKVDSPSR